ncbi:gp3 [Sclerotinia sclerotiorum negative-stranded RNA virus 2A]|uniref:Gp3 n=1 Tax=Sclerotinia sclerotiorum negative-stranded RNA virus 2A TaxID=3071284 RepID=A0A2Z4QKJ7_9MONO|nr:gp3 [Sclerotinia sclerotiorum negative-stranded RNA virus 2-A]AWY11019.1 gp3 [Sclerotinia sclerotiorum negative-stranded RNA virus 2-A]
MSRLRLPPSFSGPVWTFSILGVVVSSHPEISLLTRLAALRTIILISRSTSLDARVALLRLPVEVIAPFSIEMTAIHEFCEQLPIHISLSDLNRVVDISLAGLTVAPSTLATYVAVASASEHLSCEAKVLTASLSIGDLPRVRRREIRFEIVRTLNELDTTLRDKVKLIQNDIISSTMISTVD